MSEGSSARNLNKPVTGSDVDALSGPKYNVTNKRASKVQGTPDQQNNTQRPRQNTTGSNSSRRTWLLRAGAGALLVAGGGVEWGLGQVGNILWPQYESESNAYKGLRSIGAVALYVSHGTHNLGEYMIKSGLAVKDKSGEVVPTDPMNDLLHYAEGHKRMDALIRNANAAPGNDTVYNTLLAYGLSRKCEEEEITSGKLNSQYSLLRMVDSGFNAGESYWLDDQPGLQQYATANSNLCNVLNTTKVTKGAVADANNDAVLAMANSLQKVL